MSETVTEAELAKLKAADEAGELPKGCFGWYLEDPKRILEAQAATEERRVEARA